MAQDQTLGRGSAAADHVLIRSADVGGDDFQNYAMRRVFSAKRVRLALGHLQLGVGDRLNFHHAGLDISYSTIRCHTSCLLLFLRQHGAFRCASKHGRSISKASLNSS